ncbi:WecB/TagA/CpsF family glycosyltransferase [Butyrivibrio sp. XPD2006]|uniref:WecB/TagA/CpsF family glycosyltransferase n=1 Tax=Butyrivibrio sp. XPD2006 TaxID=1280668 RepID=UPI0003B30E07|nr:WecB/TagA/CpsF family glycosyltransferase [Butyrivibrio sp. XPD2006]
MDKNLSIKRNQNNSKKNHIVRYTFAVDMASILGAFFLAIVIRFKAIINWADFSLGIYVNMLISAILLEIAIYFFNDLRKASVVEMDPVDNLIAVVKNRFLLIILSIVYFYITQSSVLTSRIVMGLFLTFSTVFGYIFRMLYRHVCIKKWGMPGSAKVFEVHLPNIDVEAIDRAVNVEGCEGIILFKDNVSDSELNEALKALEEKGIRTYVTLRTGSYQVRPGIITDISEYATIPGYIRKERFELFGVRFCISRIEEAVHHVIDHLDNLKGEYICFSNVHTTVMARENKDYADVLNGAAYVFPDGAPIAGLEVKKGYQGVERVAGPDFMENMFRDTQYTGVSHYFYGSTEETIESLKARIARKFPGLDVRGFYSPPFRPLTPEEDAEDVRRINESGADIVWIGLGAPKQEKWMNTHRGQINAVMMGVGAGFDFHAGTIQRAPKWIRRIGLEWLYRLFKDPVRLYKRYIVTNVKFFWYLLVNKINAK